MVAETGQAQQVNQLTHLSGYHRTTISSWLSKYRQGGLDALLAVRSKPGRPTAITGKIRQQLERKLQDSEGFSSYKEVQRWLHALAVCRCLTLAVHKTVRYHLKAKLKQPRPRSENQLPGAVESFKKTPETSCSLTGVTINSVSMLGRFVTLCADESRVGLLSVQLVNSLAWESNPSVSYSRSFSTVGSTG
ncbi:MAG: hypothetical protein BRC43_09425 [Cyanobacteria bacterium QS_3_48_167]|nr:MAG: hypothetical protein BRC43_09425 [Cyanobacteria bacterium QS_3_48_167]